jgi:hypothetical protein
VAVGGGVSLLASSASTWLPATIVSSIALVVSFATFVLAARRARLDRQRQVFAEAFEAAMEYREYPYIVRRRSPEEPAVERTRISGELSKVQARLNSFKARLLVEDGYVGQRYAELVARTKLIAGGHIKAAWENPPVSADEEMHAPRYDFGDLDMYDGAYLQAVADHLGWIYAPLRRRIRGRLSVHRRGSA